MRGLALSLNFNDDYFHDEFNPAFPLLALWHYPPVREESDSWGVGPHTDYGVLTILMQDDVGGLQVETNRGDWIDVTPIPGRNSDFVLLKSHQLSLVMSLFSPGSLSSEKALTDFNFDINILFYFLTTRNFCLKKLLRLISRNNIRLRFHNAGIISAVKREDKP